MENYTVKKGDTIESIASLYNVTPYQIIEANKLMMPYFLTEGQTLIIPVSDYDIFDYYQVVKNDSLYKIASANNTTVDMLALINGIKTNEYIYPGQTILVPKKNVRLYITKMGDSILSVSKALNISQNELLNNNRNIYLLPEQLIVYRR